MSRLVVPLAAFFGWGTIAMASPLDDFRWEARPLLVFAASADDDPYEEQRLALSRNLGGLSERDMAVFLMPGDRPPTILVGAGPAQDPGPALRKAYDVAPADFVVILVGKDGGEKRRWTSPVAPDEIFTLIDAMPMRRDEMRSRP
jgi:hypothetical protein